MLLFCNEIFLWESMLLYQDAQTNRASVYYDYYKITHFKVKMKWKFTLSMHVVNVIVNDSCMSHLSILFFDLV